MLLKIAIVLSTVFASLISQVNTKLIAQKLNGNFISLFTEFTFSQSFFLLFRLAVPALASLLLTVFGYTKFGFLQLLLSQTIFYVGAFLVDVFYFHQPFSSKMAISSLLILFGVYIAIK